MLAVMSLPLLLVAPGCAHVKPWQKEHMAKMKKHVDDGARARAFEAKMWMVREGAAGGSGKPGGGCGCN